MTKRAIKLSKSEEKKEMLFGITGALNSQTGCSFDGNLANVCRSIGILIDSLSRASCNLRE